MQGERYIVRFIPFVVLGISGVEGLVLYDSHLFGFRVAVFVFAAGNGFCDISNNNAACGTFCDGPRKDPRYLQRVLPSLGVSHSLGSQLNKQARR